MTTRSLSAAHRGYAYQDVVTAFMLADGVITNQRLDVDTKVHALDIFDDVSTRGLTHQTRRQFKTSLNDVRLLQLEDLSTNQSHTRIDDLVRSFKGDAESASEYRLCVTWKIQPSDPLMKFLKPISSESSFHPYRTRLFRLLFDLVWPPSEKPVWEPLRDATDISRADFVSFCERFMVEAECPTASLDLTGPGQLERLLFDKLSQEVGVERYPNESLGVTEAAAMLITLATRARASHESLLPTDTIKYLGLRIDYGSVAQQFPVDERILVDTDKLLANLISCAAQETRILVTGEPGCGKSWALTQLGERLSDETAIVARHYCYLEPGDPDVQRRIRTNALFGNLLSELAEKEPELSKTLRPRFSAGPDELEELLTRLHDLRPNKRVYLIVDGLDHISRVFAESVSLSLDDVDIVQRLALLSLPANVCLIVGSQPGDHLTPLRPIAHSFKMPGWTSDDLVSLAENIGVDDALREGGFGEPLDDFHEELVRRSDGNPLYATLVCKQIKVEVASGVLVIDPVARIREIPVHEGDLGRYYTYLLSGADATDVADILGVIDFAVTEAELGEMLPQAGHRIGQSLRRLAPILEQVALQGGIRIYHESFRRFIVHRLEQEGASIAAILSPAISWLQKKTFYGDVKAYRFLLGSLRRADRHDEIYDLCGPSFVSRSVASGHAPDAIIQNILILIEAASRQQNWPLLARASELQRSVSTLVFEGIDVERYGRTFAAVYGVTALNERLLFEGRPTYSLAVGLILCSLCDDGAEIPPWKEYLGLPNEHKGDDVPHDFELAWFHGYIRLRGHEAGFRLLSEFLRRTEKLPPHIRDFIRRLGKEAGPSAIERLANVAAVSPAAHWVACLEWIKMIFREGKFERASEIASQVLQEKPPIEFVFECLRLGAPISMVDVSAVDPESYDIGIGSGSHYPDEISVRRWFSTIGVLARASDIRLDQELKRVEGVGWYRCWLRYVIGLCKADSMFQGGMEGAAEQIVTAFEELGKDVEPFRGEPRACDLYGLGELIHETVERGLSLLADANSWKTVLPILSEVSIRTTTFLQNAPSGPLDGEALFRVLKPFVTNSDIREPIVNTIEQRLFHSRQSGGLYYSLASQELLLAEISASVASNASAITHWNYATQYMCAYGQRKDVTIYELLNSFHALAGLDQSVRMRAIALLQPAVDAVVDHTDGRETRHSPISWFECFYEVNPEAACLILTKSMLKNCGVFDWRLEESFTHVLKKQDAGSENWLIVSLLGFASPPSENKTAHLIALDRIENLFQEQRGLGRQLLELLFATHTGDIVIPDSELLLRAADLAKSSGVPFLKYVDLFPPRDSTKQTNYKESHRHLSNRELSENINFPTDHSLQALMKTILGIRTGFMESPPHRDRIVNFIGYSLLELVAQGNEAHARTLLKLLARRRWFVSDATHMANLGEGLERHGHGELAATAFALAFTRSRGGGGWLTFGGDKHLPWFLTAFQLSQEVALQTLAEETSRYLDGSSAVYGVTKHLIEVFGALGRTDVAAASWWEAFGVVDHRLPRNADGEGVFANSQELGQTHKIGDPLVLLLLARLSSPYLPSRVAAIAGLARLCSIIPERIAHGMSAFLSFDLSTTTLLELLKAVLDFDPAPYKVAMGIRESLERFAITEQFAIAEISKILLRRAHGEISTRRTLVGLHSVRLPKKKEKAVLSLDVGDRVQLIQSFWPKFPSLLASQFDFVWKSSEDHHARWRSRERLAHSVGNRSCPRAPVLSWSREIFERVFQDVLNHMKPLAIDGTEWDPDIVRALLDRLLPDMRTYVAHWYSRIVRPTFPLPVDQIEGSGKIVAVPHEDECGGWFRLGYYEEQLILEPDRVLPKCTGEISVSGGIVSALGARANGKFLPFGTGKVSAWWRKSLYMPRDRSARFMGPLVGLDFVRSFLGLHPILIPHPKYLDPYAVSLAPQPGPLLWRDGNGNPCVKFRWWKVRPLDKDIDESVSLLNGCDLVVRDDIWQHISRLSKPPLTFERTISRRDILDGDS